MTKTSKLQAETQEKEAQLLELQDKRRQSKEQIDALEAERHDLVVAARVHRNLDAQKAIERLVAKITKAQDEDALNGEAFVQISGEIEAIKAELRGEQWRERCAAVRQLIEPRVAGDLEQKALGLALDLKRTLGQIAASDGEIVVALQSIHPSLLPCADRVGRMRTRVPEMISGNLAPVLENPFSKAYLDNIGRDPQASAVQNFREVLQALDNVAELEPAAERV